MPDYQPLYNLRSGVLRRVFSTSGEPVFARVRDGVLTPSVNVTVAFASHYVSYWGVTAPGGSTVASAAPDLTRSSYASFSAFAATDWSAEAYLGADSDGRTWWLSGRVRDVSVIYQPVGGGGTGFRLSLTADARVRYQLGGLSGYYSNAVAQWGVAKVSDPHLPDGEYTHATPVVVNGHYTLTLSVPLSAAFSET